MRYRATLCCLLLAAGLPTRVEARTTCKEEYVDLIRKYELLVIAYRAGDESTVAAWGSWSTEQARSVISGIDGPCDPMKPWPSERFTAAAMLATDLGQQQLVAKDAVAAVGQFNVAVALFARAGPPVWDFATRWFEAAAVRLRSEVLLWEAATLLEKGRQVVPNHPRILYQCGITAEFLMVVNMNALDVFAREPAPPAGLLREGWWQDQSRSKKVVREQAERAERWLADAAQAGIPLAPPHLARVLLLRDKPLNALAVVDPFLDKTTDNASAYIAALLSGAAHEASGDLKGATERYTRAIARNPQGEFGYVALSHALMRQGRYDDARVALAPVLANRQRDVSLRDPWWMFGSDLGRPLDDAFAELRQEARR